MWFQHEFMHHLYRVWYEFGLEETGHQWFTRSTWPADFIGAWEPDYYAESITKRLLDASNPTLAEGLTAVEMKNYDITDPSVLVGSYKREPVQNGYHEVDISLNENSLTWMNAANISWSLEIIEKRLWSGSDCPYGKQQINIFVEDDNTISYLIFNDEKYIRIN